MTLLRLLNPQGIAGLAAALCLAILLVIQKGDTRHYRKQAAEFEQLYHGEQSALAGTVASYRAAAEQARAADEANARRVRAAQALINERTSDDYEARIAVARATAQRLRVETASTSANSGRRSGAAVPSLPVATSGAASTTAQDGLSPEDALTATEQAIQLDELIEWIRRQHEVDSNQP